MDSYPSSHLVSLPSEVPADLTEQNLHELVILEMTHTLLANGCPSHHLEEHIKSAAAFMKLSLDVVCLPNAVFLSFHAVDDYQHGRMHILRERTGLALSILAAAHDLHRKLLKDYLDPKEALIEFHKLNQHTALLSPIQRALLSFTCAFCFTVASASGSVLDSLTAALEMVFLVTMTYCYHGSALIAQAIQYVNTQDLPQPLTLI
jgi:uncharacterized membrane protein YjjP (DUF1212 family)